MKGFLLSLFHFQKEWLSMTGLRIMVSEYQDDLRLHSIIHNSSLVLASLFSYNQIQEKISAVTFRRHLPDWWQTWGLPLWACTTSAADCVTFSIASLKALERPAWFYPDRHMVVIRCLVCSESLISPASLHYGPEQQQHYYIFCFVYRYCSFIIWLETIFC